LLCLLLSHAGNAAKCFGVLACHHERFVYMQKRLLLHQGSASSVGQPVQRQPSAALYAGSNFSAQPVDSTLGWLAVALSLLFHKHMLHQISSLRAGLCSNHVPGAAVLHKAPSGCVLD
jgi:hypothetical protein